MAATRCPQAAGKEETQHQPKQTARWNCSRAGTGVRALMHDSGQGREGHFPVPHTHTPRALCPCAAVRRAPSGPGTERPKETPGPSAAGGQWGGGGTLLNPGAPHPAGGRGQGLRRPPRHGERHVAEPFGAAESRTRGRPGLVFGGGCGGMEEEKRYPVALPSPLGSGRAAGGGSCGAGQRHSCRRPGCRGIGEMGIL